MKFTLSEEDAARLECPRDVEFDDTRLTGREAIAMKKLTGWTFERFGQAFAGERVVDDDGQQVWELDDTGAVKKDEAGNRVPLRSVDPEAILVGVWLAVRRTAGDRPWKGFDVNFIPLMQGDEVEEGKADPSETTNQTTNPTTESTST